MILYAHDVRGLAHLLFGYSICRHCVRMLRLAIEGKGEYIVLRCGRCGLAVDSRPIETWKRDEMLGNAYAKLAWLG